MNKAMLNWLGMKPSYSRSRVSDDIPYAEALFRTDMYRAKFPVNGIVDLQATRSRGAGFVHWYNVKRRQCAIRLREPSAAPCV